MKQEPLTVARRSLAKAASIPAALVLIGCGSSTPIVLRTPAPEVPRAACPSAQRTFALVPVQDKRGYANSRNVGFTQTGLVNVKTSLETPRPAAQVLHGELERALAACGLLAPQAKPPSVWLSVELLTLQLTETTGFTSESIDGRVRFEVEALDGVSRARLKRFAALGQAEASGVDTTADAEPVFARALGVSLQRFLRGLADLPPAPVFAATSPNSSSQVAPAVRLLTKEEEEERFGKSLSERQLLPMELSIARRGTGTNPIRVRRQRVRLIFTDGSERLPLDPLKVQERHRVNGQPPYYGGGLAGGLLFAAMQNSGDTPGLETTVDELLMPTARNELKGLLFFDLEGVGGARPKRLQLEYEDATTSVAHSSILELR